MVWGAVSPGRIGPVGLGQWTLVQGTVRVPIIRHLCPWGAWQRVSGRPGELGAARGGFTGRFDGWGLVLGTALRDDLSFCRSGKAWPGCLVAAGVGRRPIRALGPSLLKPSNGRSCGLNGAIVVWQTFRARHPQCDCGVIPVVTGGSLGGARRRLTRSGGREMPRLPGGPATDLPACRGRTRGCGLCGRCAAGRRPGRRPSRTRHERLPCPQVATLPLSA